MKDDDFKTRNGHIVASLLCIIAILFLHGFVQIFFSSSNPGVATVNSEGRVTAVGPGTATITITDGFGRSGNMQVTVSGDFGPVVNSGGHAYAVTNAALPWLDVHLRARATGGYLVSVHDLQENGFLTNAFHAPIAEDSEATRIARETVRWVCGAEILHNRCAFSRFPGPSAAWL